MFFRYSSKNISLSPIILDHFPTLKIHTKPSFKTTKIDSNNESFIFICLVYLIMEYFSFNPEDPTNFEEIFPQFLDRFFPDITELKFYYAGKSIGIKNCRLTKKKSGWSWKNFNDVCQFSNFEVLKYPELHFISYGSQPPKLIPDDEGKYREIIVDGKTLKYTTDEELYKFFNGNFQKNPRYIYNGSLRPMILEFSKGNSFFINILRIKGKLIRNGFEEIQTKFYQRFKTK